MTQSWTPASPEPSGPPQGAAPDVAPTPPPAPPGPVPGPVPPPGPVSTVAAAPTAGPFDPPGVAWQRVSPRLVTVRLITLGIWLGLPTVAAFVLAAVTGAPVLWVLAVVLGALTAWLAVLIPRQVGAIGYAERDDDLLIRKGIMFRALVVVPYGRMQFVDVQAGPLDRWGGIAKVQLHTASPSSDAVIPGLPPAEADRLRDRLAERGEARLAGL